MIEVAGDFLIVRKWLKILFSPLRSRGSLGQPAAQWLVEVVFDWVCGEAYFSSKYSC